MNRIMSKALVWAFLASPTSALFAGSISIQTDVQTNIQGSVVLSSVTLTNKGDEEALDVGVSLEVAGRSFQSLTASRLDPNARGLFPFRHPLAVTEPGRYPVIARIFYADRNHHPFSALAMASVTHQRDERPGVIVDIAPITLRAKSTLTLALKNLDDKPHELDGRWLLPQELSMSSPTFHLSLPARGERQESFALRNFAALAGSVYQIYGLVEYSDEGLHHSIPGSSTVRVVGNAHESTLYEDPWVIVGALIVLVFVIINVRRPRARR